LPILGRRSIDPLVVLALRHPLEVAQSLHRRDKIGMSHALAVWLRYTLDAERSSRGFRRIVQYYPNLINDWRTELAKISSGLGLAIPELTAVTQTRIDSFIDNDLRHEKTQHIMSDCNLSPNLAQWCTTVYKSIRALDKNPRTDIFDNVYNNISNFEVSLIYFEEFASYHVNLGIEHERLIAWFKSEIKRLENINLTLSEKKNYEISKLRRELEYARIDTKTRDKHIRDIYDSTSWKITEPLRIVGKLFS
jgi:hypothetical protein